MHLKFNQQGKATPDVFVVIDDFGSERNDLSDYLDNAHCPAQKQRFLFLFSEDHNPDVTRARAMRPEHYSAREAAAFASPIGLSIEAEISIEFDLHPAWDERRFEPLWTQAAGARIQVIHAGVNEWEWNPASTSIKRRALEAFCWAYIEMERAREVAEARASAAETRP